MKLGHIMAATVLLAPILFVGTTEPAAAANTHAVTLDGWVKALDYEPTGSSQRFADFKETISLSHDAPRQTFRTSVCAGDEAVAELTVDLFLTKGERVIVGPYLKLYEFQDCNHSDLEGTYSPGPRTVLMGQAQSHRLAIGSREYLSPDGAEARFTTTHTKAAVDVGRPNEPSNVIASAPNIRLICAFLGQPCKEKIVRVEWQDNANNETGYEIRNTTLDQRFGFGPNTTQFTFTNLAKITHCFQVRAVGAAGPSDWTPVGEKVECA